MTDEQREAVQRLQDMIGLIQTGSDGYALPDEGLHLHILSMQVLRVDTALAGCSGPAELSALALADATSRWLGEMISGRRDPDIAQRWFQARAELIEPLEP
jgi:hypothetical protein